MRVVQEGLCQREGQACHLQEDQAAPGVQVYQQKARCSWRWAHLAQEATAGSAWAEAVQAAPMEGLEVGASAARRGPRAVQPCSLLWGPVAVGVLLHLEGLERRAGLREGQGDREDRG